MALNHLLVEFSTVDRFWNTEHQLSVVRETILSLSLPPFTLTRRDWSPTVVNEIHNYVSTLIGRRLEHSASCGAQLSSRLFCMFNIVIQMPRFLLHANAVTATANSSICPCVWSTLALWWTLNPTHTVKLRYNVFLGTKKSVHYRRGTL